MSKYTFIFSVLLLAVLALLVWAAFTGSLLAAVILTMLTTILLVATGASIALVTQKMANSRAQSDFVNNAKENLSIMAAMQTVQNKQNSLLLNQVRQLPAGGTMPGLTVEDSIFEELEQ